MEKRYYEKMEENEYRIEGKKGEMVSFITRSVYGSGEAYYFEDYVLSRQFTILTYKLSDGAVKTWPVVKWVVEYDEENEALLVEDYIEGIVVDEKADENPLVTSIFYYISLDGRILSGAYNEITDTIYPLDNLEGAEIYSNFKSLYGKTKRRIAKLISEELKNRREKVTYDNLNKEKKTCK